MAKKMSSDTPPGTPPPQYRPKNRYFRTMIDSYGVDQPDFKYLSQNHLKTEYQADDLISPRWLHSGQSNTRWFYSKEVTQPENIVKSPGSEKFIDQASDYGNQEWFDECADRAVECSEDTNENMETNSDGEDFPDNTSECTGKTVFPELGPSIKVKEEQTEDD